MIIKKYLVNNMNEAMTRIRYELGKNAIIINQRKVRKPGFLGFFTKKMLEVTAAIENEAKDEVAAASASVQAFQKVIEENKKLQEKRNDTLDVNKNLDILKEKSNVIIKNKEAGEKETLLKEMTEMKSMLNNMMTMGTLKENKGEIEKKLESVDIEPIIIKKIVSKVNAMEEGTEEERLKIVLKDMIKVHCPSENKHIVLVGPTGVGKTTTIAKLAGRLSLIEKKSVGLITIDTYRIGAVEQLKTYADIMNIPFKVVMTIKEMERAVDSMKDCDTILIDTTGRSSKNTMQISELRAFVDKVNTENIHLVMSSTTKNRDIDVIVNGYKQLNYKSVIITKLDETSTYGSVLSILNSAKTPISYVTTGQNVPDDIKIMSKEAITNLILGEDSIC